MADNGATRRLPSNNKKSKRDVLRAERHVILLKDII
jgi:hypothetical protein